LARSFRQVGGSARRIIGSMGRRSQQSTPVRMPALRLALRASFLARFEIALRRSAVVSEPQISSRR
jgi:hypothetical protein